MITHPRHRVRIKPLAAHMGEAAPATGLCQALVSIQSDDSLGEGPREQLLWFPAGTLDRSDFDADGRVCIWLAWQAQEDSEGGGFGALREALELAYDQADSYGMADALFRVEVAGQRGFEWPFMVSAESLAARARRQYLDMRTPGAPDGAGRPGSRRI